MLDLFGWTAPPLAEPERGPEHELLKKVGRGGAKFDRLVLTRNRRVMASVTDGGRTLRLHERFAEAPPEVLDAVGRLFSTKSGRVRSEARARVRTFLETALPPQPPRTRRRRSHPIPASDLPHVERLRAEFRAVNERYFSSSLPEVPIRLSGRMIRRNGHFSSDPLEIAISRSLCTDAVDGEAFRTLRHEMIHLWQWVENRKLGHGREFRRWARILEIHPRATRTVCWQGDPATRR